MAVTPQDLERIVNPLFKNLSDKIDHISEMLGKDIETLKKQSAEHYIEADKIKEKIQFDVTKVKEDCDKSIAGIGERVGKLEQNTATTEIEIKNIETRLDKKSSNKKWTIEMWIVLGVAIGGPLLLDFLRSGL